MAIQILNGLRAKDEVYVQYPGTKPPADLFGGTWKAIFDEDSVFFRTGGVDSNPFGGEVQSDAMRNLTGSVSVGGAGGHGAVTGAGGVFAATGGKAGYLSTSGTKYNNWRSFDMDISRQVPTADEVRPKNLTIRVWVNITT